jgi:hypothetical protein
MMNVIPDYLKMTADMIRQRPQGFQYSSLFEFGLKHGKLMKAVANPFDVVPRGIPRQCFMNATNLALGKKSFMYCEGWALNVVPVPHAWNLVEVNGRWVALDTTWPEPGKEYFGIVFTTAYLRKAMQSQKYYGLIDAYCSGWPLLKMKASETRKWKNRIMDKL